MQILCLPYAEGHETYVLKTISKHDKGITTEEIFVYVSRQTKLFSPKK